MAPAIPAGARPPAPPGLSRSSPLLGFISPRQHGPHRGFPHTSGPSSPPQQHARLREPLWLPALPLATHMRSEVRARSRVLSAYVQKREFQKGAKMNGFLQGVCATRGRTIGQ